MNKSEQDVEGQLRGAVQALSSTTAGVIQWEYLTRLLETAPKPVSERARCDLILAAANRRALTGEQWTQLIGIRTGGAPKGEAVPVPVPEQVVSMLIDRLEVIVAADESKRRMLTRALARDIRNKVLLTPSWSGRRDPHVIAVDIIHAINYGLWLMLDGEYAAKLKRCQYSECREFFFSRPAKGGKGAPSRTYCRPAHVEFGEREKARDRMRRNRGMQE